MKKPLNHRRSWVCGVGLVIAASVATVHFGPFVSDMYRLGRIKKDLRERSDRLELGRLMADLLENPEMARTGVVYSENPAMPGRLRELGKSSLSLEPEVGQASLMLGGGYESYGYLVKRKETDGVFTLYYWNEHRKKIEDLGQFQK